MSKAEGMPEREPGPAWTDESIESLMMQFRFMLAHEVKTMKLDIVENLGAMLARRSGLDRELHELGERIEFVAKVVDGLLLRVEDIEKAGGIQPLKPSSPGPIGSRALAAPGEHRTKKVPAVQKPAPVDPAHRIGRPPGKGRYEAYNAAKREKKTGGTS